MKKTVTEETQFRIESVVYEMKGTLLAVECREHDFHRFKEYENKKGLPINEETLIERSLDD